MSSRLLKIPAAIWEWLRKLSCCGCCSKVDSLSGVDVPFTLSTKITTLLTILLLILSFLNEFVRNIEIDCVYNGSPTGGGRDAELNDWCWNQDTFLVSKALEPEAREKVPYPGVSSYERGKDVLIRLRYYKQVWLGLSVVLLLASLPSLLWKLRRSPTLKDILQAEASEEHSQEEIRVHLFLQSVGFNRGFGLYFFLCKCFAASTPFLIWIFLVGFVGNGYKAYGWKALAYWMSSEQETNWPNPMDSLFPKMSKCEWVGQGFGVFGDDIYKLAQCQLPMNSVNQWSFLVLWWWILAIFLVNVVSCINLSCLWIFPAYRSCRLGKWGGTADRQDDKGCRNMHLNFGDWLLLSFLQRHLTAWQFREFMSLLAMENSDLQLGAMQSEPEDDEDDAPVARTKDVIEEEEEEEEEYRNDEDGDGLRIGTHV